MLVDDDWALCFVSVDHCPDCGIQAKDHSPKIPAASLMHLSSAQPVSRAYDVAPPFIVASVVTGALIFVAKITKFIFA